MLCDHNLSGAAPPAGGGRSIRPGDASGALVTLPSGGRIPGAPQRKPNDTVCVRVSTVQHDGRRSQANASLMRGGPRRDTPP